MERTERERKGKVVSRAVALAPIGGGRKKEKKRRPGGEGPLTLRTLLLCRVGVCGLGARCVYERERRSRGGARAEKREWKCERK